MQWCCSMTIYTKWRKKTITFIKIGLWFVAKRKYFYVGRFSLPFWLLKLCGKSKCEPSCSTPVPAKSLLLVKRRFQKLLQIKNKVGKKLYLAFGLVLIACFVKKSVCPLPTLCTCPLTHLKKDLCPYFLN